VSPLPVHVLRPLVHAGTGLVALSLGVLPRPWALAGAALGVVVGWLVLPMTPLDARLRRPGEPFLGGLRTYPLAVLGLVLLLPPAEAAAAWGVLAVGDACAALVGQAVPAPRLLGHRKATLSGSGAYVALGGLAAFGLATAVGVLAARSGLTEAGPVPSLGACLLAAAAAAILDLAPLPPDDNVPAAAAAGGVLYASRMLL
jgi:dolichol kinase